MSTIRATVYYEPGRMFTRTRIIPNVPICLYDDGSGEGVIVLTDSNGEVEFTNVPIANYRIIECYGQTSTLTGSANYLLDKITLSLPDSLDPPITMVPPPVTSLATNLDSMSPNTIFTTIASISDDIVVEFFDAPIQNLPVSLVGANFIGSNSINEANHGDFGEWPNGTAVNTVAYPNPYPNIIDGLSYSSSYPPGNGNVCVVNTNNGYSDWWQISDHTLGYEAGRFLVVNGANPGAIFFQDTISVLPDTDYVLLLWVININRSPWSFPAMGITVKDENGDILYNYILNQLVNTNPAQWNQLGCIINSGTHTIFEIELSTQNPLTSGNDYAVDDIELFQVEFTDVLAVSKSANTSIVMLDDLITFTTTIHNTSTSNIESVLFEDIIDSNVSFIPSSILVNGSGVGFEGMNPDTSFEIGPLAANETITVSFQVRVTNNQNHEILNQAQVHYSSFASPNDDYFYMETSSNIVRICIVNCNMTQQITDVIESVALVQTSLSHILNAEGEKLQKIVEIATTVEELTSVNDSVKDMVNAVTRLELILQSKLGLFQCSIRNQCN